MKKIILENENIFMLPEDRAEELGFKVISEKEKLIDLVFFKSETNEMVWIWRDGRYYYLVSRDLDNIITRFYSGKGKIDDIN